MSTYAQPVIPLLPLQQRFEVYHQQMTDDSNHNNDWPDYIAYIWRRAQNVTTPDTAITCEQYNHFNTIFSTEAEQNILEIPSDNAKWLSNLRLADDVALYAQCVETL